MAETPPDPGTTLIDDFWKKTGEVSEPLVRAANATKDKLGPLAACSVLVVAVGWLTQHMAMQYVRVGTFESIRETTVACGLGFVMCLAPLVDFVGICRNRTPASRAYDSAAVNESLSEKILHSFFLVPRSEEAKKVWKELFHQLGLRCFVWFWGLVFLLFVTSNPNVWAARWAIDHGVRGTVPSVAGSGLRSILRFAVGGVFLPEAERALWILAACLLGAAAYIGVHLKPPRDPIAGVVWRGGIVLVVSFVIYTYIIMPSRNPALGGFLFQYADVPASYLPRNIGGIGDASDNSSRSLEGLGVLPLFPPQAPESQGGGEKSRGGRTHRVLLITCDADEAVVADAGDNAAKKCRYVWDRLIFNPIDPNMPPVARIKWTGGDKADGFIEGPAAPSEETQAP